MLYPSFSRRARAVWWRNLLAWRKFCRSSILLNFGEPVMNLVALGFGLGAYVTRIGDRSFLEFIAPGLLAVTAMNSVVYDLGFDGFDRLRTTGVYDAMATSPLSVSEIVGGELLWEATRSIIYGLVFLSVLAAFGLVHSVWVAGLPVVLFLNGFLFGALTLAVVSVAQVHEHLFFYFTLVITPMFMFSGVFFPVDRMPSALAWVVKAFPLYHVVELTRSLVLGGVSAANLVHLGWLLFLTLAALALPVPLLQRALYR
ncbi:MAG: ABC transporter permease [Betaproteobacteria bacterium]